MNEQLMNKSQLSLSSINHSKSNSNITANPDQFYNNSSENPHELEFRPMPEVKFQFGSYSAKDNNTPKSQISTQQDRSVTPISQTNSQRGQKLNGKQSAESLLQNFLFKPNNNQVTKDNKNVQVLSQSYTPNKLTQIIQHSINRSKSPKSRNTTTSSSKTVQQKMPVSVASKLIKESVERLSRPISKSRANNSSFTSKGTNEQQRSRSKVGQTTPNTGRSRSRSATSNNKNIKQRDNSKQRTRTPDSLRQQNQFNDAQFKQQFIQYLEVLKQKVAEMELKVRESQNEKNFYKQRYLEQDEILTQLREKEKLFAVEVAQLKDKYEQLQDKYDKKKSLVNSMQSIICSQSVALELQRNKLRNENVGNDQISQSSSQKFISNGGFSPYKNRQNFKFTLNEKSSLAVEIENENFQLHNIEWNPFDKRSTEESLLVENQELMQFLTEEGTPTRKQKFQSLCKLYNLDSILHLQNFYSDSPIKDSQSLHIDADLDNFIQFIVKKLKTEQVNRLKTEEQSAQVIEQLGKTIARLEVKRKDYSGTSSWNNRGGNLTPTRSQVTVSETNSGGKKKSSSQLGDF